MTGLGELRKFYPKYVVLFKIWGMNALWKLKDGKVSQTSKMKGSMHRLLCGKTHQLIRMDAYSTRTMPIFLFTKTLCLWPVLRVVSTEICFLSIYSLECHYYIVDYFSKMWWEHQLLISVWWSFFSQYLETPRLISG